MKVSGLEGQLEASKRDAEHKGQMVQSAFRFLEQVLDSRLRELGSSWAELDLKSNKYLAAQMLQAGIYLFETTPVKKMVKGNTKAKEEELKDDWTPTELAANQTVKMGSCSSSEGESFVIFVKTDFKALRDHIFY